MPATSGTLYKAHVMRVLWQYGLADGMYNQVYRSLFGLKPVRGKILHTPKYETVDTVLDLIRACAAWRCWRTRASIKACRWRAS